MTAIDLVVAVHTDVVCPPDPSALCGHCGIGLGDHTTLGPDAAPTPSNAICLDDAALLAKDIVWNRFTLAPGQTLDCPRVGLCEECGADICDEHSVEFAACVDNQHQLHHLDCRDQCTSCMRGVAEDAAEDRAIEEWKGMW